MLHITGNAAPVGFFHCFLCCQSGSHLNCSKACRAMCFGPSIGWPVYNAPLCANRPVGLPWQEPAILSSRLKQNQNTPAPGTRTFTSVIKGNCADGCSLWTPFPAPDKSIFYTTDHNQPDQACNTASAAVLHYPGAGAGSGAGMFCVHAPYLVQHITHRLCHLTDVLQIFIGASLLLAEYLSIYLVRHLYPLVCSPSMAFYFYLPGQAFFWKTLAQEVSKTIYLSFMVINKNFLALLRKHDAIILGHGYCRMALIRFCWSDLWC